MSRRGDLKSCLSSQGIQATQGLLSRVLLNIVGQIGEARNTRLDPIKGPGVGRTRLFDGRKSGSESFTRPVAWIVGDVLTVSLERLVSVSDEGFDLVVPQSQTDGAHRLLTRQRNRNDIKRPFLQGSA